MTLLQTGDRQLRAWEPAFGQPAATSHRLPYAAPRKRVIVAQGEKLSPANDAHVRVVAHEQARRPSTWPQLAGSFVLHLTLALGLTAYLRRFGQCRLKLLRTQVGVLLAIAAVAVVAKLTLLFTALPAFWIPVGCVPLWIAASFDRRTAFVVALVLGFEVAALHDLDLILLCVFLVLGMAAALFYARRTRSMPAAGLFAGSAGALLYVALAFSLQGGLDVWADVSVPLRSDLIGSVGGGLLAGVLAALLRAPAERLLGHVSRQRLLDLTDLEQPLLKRLASDAPGTFEHSRAMANLAEQASSSIGADALLTRVGAYYHDLGKTAQAKYFVENLGHDERSPHEELDPEVSADAIMAHVVIGTQLLREGGIPEPIVEFAYTHHGTQIVEYFWNKCQAQGNPKQLTAAAFRYPGMKPQTRETAILMLVDSIEAASRTVDPPERDGFEAMVQRVVFTKLKQGQLDESGLNLSELKIIVNRMADTLANMHHHRIKYQWQVKRAEEFGVSPHAVRERSESGIVATRDSGSG